MFTIILAAVASTPGFQPEIVPSSVTNRKRAGFPGAREKLVPPLNKVPVGVPVLLTLGFAGGMVTTSDSVAPVPSYSVERPVPLSEIHHGLPELLNRPHGLTRLMSVFVFIPPGRGEVLLLVMLRCERQVHSSKRHSE